MPKNSRMKQFTVHDDYEGVVYAIIYAEDKFDAEEDLIKLATGRGDLPTGEPLDVRFSIEPSNVPVVNYPNQ